MHACMVQLSLALGETLGEVVEDLPGEPIEWAGELDRFDSG